MNNKNLIKIARSIFLQDTISKQLFAETWNPNKNIDDSVGSFAGRDASTVYKLFSIFRGSQFTIKVIQFIEKEGNNYAVYPIDDFGQPDYQSQPIRILGSLQQLHSFLQTNNAMSVQTDNSLSQQLKNLYTVISYTPFTAKKYKHNINIDQYVKKYEKSQQHYKDILFDIINDIVQKWSADISNRIDKILKLQDLNQLPIIFDQTKNESPATIIRSLQEIISNAFLTYLDYDKITFKDEDKTTNGIWQNVDRNIKAMSRNLLAKKQISRLNTTPTKGNQQGNGQKGNNDKNQKMIGNVTQHVRMLQRFISALKKANEINGSYTKQQILNAIQESNTNYQLIQKWAQCNKLKMDQILSFQQDQEAPNSKTGTMQSKLVALMHFLNGQSKMLGVNTWLPIKQYLIHTFADNQKYLDYINQFDKVFNFLTNNTFRTIIGQKATIDRSNLTTSTIEQITKKANDFVGKKGYDLVQSDYQKFANDLQNHVATLQQLNNLKSCGCGYVQRYLNAKGKRLVTIISCFNWQKQFDELATTAGLNDAQKVSIKQNINVSSKTDIRRSEFDGLNDLTNNLLKCLLPQND